MPGTKKRRVPFSSCVTEILKLRDSSQLYTDQEEIVTALGGSGIGQVVGDLLEKEIPQEVRVLEGL